MFLSLGPETRYGVVPESLRVFRVGLVADRSAGPLGGRRLRGRSRGGGAVGCWGAQLLLRCRFAGRCLEIRSYCRLMEWKRRCAMQYNKGLRIIHTNYCHNDALTGSTKRFWHLYINSILEATRDIISLGTSFIFEDAMWWVFLREGRNNLKLRLERHSHAEVNNSCKNSMAVGLRRGNHLVVINIVLPCL